MPLSPTAVALMNEINAKAVKNGEEPPLVTGSDIFVGARPRCVTGSLSLDSALGGGWPLNQWVEIVGRESSGKSALVYKTIAMNQALDPEWSCIWFDAEGSWDNVWATQLGVDTDRVIVVDENSMEFVYNTAIKYLDSRAVDCVVVDSLPALSPTSEDDSEIEEFQVGLHARLTGKFFRKQRSAIRRSLVEEERPVLGIMINQWREKIGIMMGDPRTTPGGNGKNYFYVVRVEVKRSDWIGDKNKRYGQTVAFHCFKNKTGVPQRSGEFDFYFADYNGFVAGDIDRLKEVVNLGVANGVIAMTSNGIYTFDENKWRGRVAMVDAIRNDTGLQRAIEDGVLGISRPPKKVTRTIRKG